MAPVGRWQQDRDLLWYSKGEKLDEEEKARRNREEIQRVKDAEQEAMARALGLPVPPKSASANNANLTPLGGKDVQKAIRDSTADEDLAEERMGRGVGFGSYGGGAAAAHAGGENEKLEAVGLLPDQRGDRRCSRSRSPRRERRRDRGGDRDRERERRHRRHHDDRERHHHRSHRHRHRSRSRSASRDRDRPRRRSYSRSRSRDRRRVDDEYKRPRQAERDFSPEHRGHRSHRRERDADYNRRR